MRNVVIFQKSFCARLEDVKLVFSKNRFALTLIRKCGILLFIRVRAGTDYVISLGAMSAGGLLVHTGLFCCRRAAWPSNLSPWSH